MLKVKFKKIATPFRQPFTTVYETKAKQDALLVAIEYAGYRGVGEAPAISYYNIGVEDMIKELQEKAKLLEQYAFTEPQRFWHFCHHLFPENPFLVCALDLAYWDLFSQFKKQSIAQGLEIDPPKSIQTFYTIAWNNQEIDIDKLQPHPWDSYKLKITNEDSINVLRKLKIKYPKSDFAVDVNASWSLIEAKKYVPMLADLEVLFIEQPLAKDNYREMLELKSDFDVPFYADESFQSEKDLENCAACFDGINIKFAKCGGLSPAVKILEKASDYQLQTMLGCMNETEVGIYPAAQLGGMTTYNDLDGALLLDTPLQKMQYANGQIILKEF